MNPDFSSSDLLHSKPSRLSDTTNEQALILIADDDPTFRQALGQKLQTAGYQIVEAVDGAECLAFYEAQQPDLILLDARMPIVDGFNCCQTLTTLTDRMATPIVMVTTLDDPESVERAFAAGATDYITKPVHWAILCQRINHLLEQARLYRQVQRLNTELDRQMQACYVETQERTAQFYRALEFEATLKRITDRVRDSLDENQILQTAIQELAWALNVGCCNASLYDQKMGTARVHYEYTASIMGYQDRVIDMDAYPEIYQQICRGEHLQFCSLMPSPIRGRVSMFACPMLNEQGSIGDLWLINPADRALNEMEIRLVQQVANQCAIAIRQARLYQASQAQVAELEKLNQLKDNFLSTVSHELRTPMSNMRLAIQALKRNLLLGKEAGVGVGGRSACDPDRNLAYLRILHEECEREIGLINDLLDLQQLEAGCRFASFSTIYLQDWLPSLVERCRERAETRQQNLALELDVHLPPMTTDTIGLSRVLSELLDNACKYTPAQGVIKLTVLAQLQTVEFQVQNSGIEIPPEELPYIFDKFHRVPSGDPWKQGGTGLGLALTKRLVSHLGGTIQAHSSSGQTCFTVQLPLQSHAPYASGSRLLE